MSSPPWTIRRTIGPTTYPVSLPEAKLHLRISGDHFDELVLRAIGAATEQVEADTDRAILDQTYQFETDKFPRTSSAIPVPIKPVSAVASVTYTDSDGTDQIMPPEDYTLDASRRQLRPVDGWPTGTLVTITFVAGYGPDPQSVPRIIGQAVLLQVGKWFVNNDMMTNDNVYQDAAYDRIINRILRTSYP